MIGRRSDRLAALLACSGALSLASAGCGDGMTVVLGQGHPDAGLDSPPFGAPVLVAELASDGNNDFKETLTADELEIYFISDRPGGPGMQDVWFSTRANAADPWGPPACAVDVSSPANETGTAISADGKTLWLGSSRPGGKGGVDIWVSTRADRSSPWATPTPVTELNTPSDEFPRPTAQGGLVMLPSVRVAPSSTYQTYTTSRPSLDASWVAYAPVVEVDTSGIDTDAFLREDGLVLYFSSDRIVADDQDLFVARRQDLSAPFGSFTALPELNSGGHDDRDPWLSLDEREVYFSSDRGGTLKIYRASR